MKRSILITILVVEAVLVAMVIRLRAMPLLVLVLAMPTLVYLALKRDNNGDEKPMAPSEMAARIERGKATADGIRALAPNVEDGIARIRLLRICDLAERIFSNFEDDPSDLAKAGRFLMYLDRFLPLVERYARLCSTPEGRELLKEEYGDQEFHELLQTAEQSFSQGFKNYLSNDVVEMKAFGRVLKRMMDVAEVGK